MERWREDFPIRWDVDNYVTRRELAKFLTLGSALLVVASGAVVTVGRMASPAEWPATLIPGGSALPPGSSLLFRYPTDADPCILVKTGRGDLKAYSQVCTHLSCAVRFEMETSSLACPCHRGYFAVENGRPTAGPPTRPLPRILLESREDGLYAVGVEV